MYKKKDEFQYIFYELNIDDDKNSSSWMAGRLGETTNQVSWKVTSKALIPHNIEKTETWKVMTKATPKKWDDVDDAKIVSWVESDKMGQETEKK